MKLPICFSITRYVCDKNCDDCNHNKFPFWFCCKFCSKCSPQREIIEGLTYYYIEIDHDQKLMIYKSLLTTNAIEHEYMIKDNILKCYIAYQGKMKFSDPLFHQNGIIYYDKMSMHGITLVSVVDNLKELCSEPKKILNKNDLYLKLVEFKNKLEAKLNSGNINHEERNNDNKIFEDLSKKYYQAPGSYQNFISLDDEIRTLMRYMYLSEFSKFLINKSIVDAYNVNSHDYNVYNFEPFEKDLTIKLEPIVLLAFENLIKIHNKGNMIDYLEALDYIYCEIEFERLGEERSKSKNYRRFNNVKNKIDSLIKENKFRTISPSLPPKIKISPSIPQKETSNITIDLELGLELD